MPKPKIASFLGTPSSNTPLSTIANGKEATIPSVKMNVDSAAKSVTVFNIASNSIVLSRTYQEIEKSLNQIIDFGFATTTYDLAKTNAVWKKLYQHAPRTVHYVEGMTLATKTEDTYPCLYCGIVLPTRLVTVDHQRPQTGGEKEAIAKVFRVLGWTIAGSKGSKGVGLTGQNLTSLQLFHQYMTVIPVPTKKGAGPKPPSTTTVGDRYTLNGAGAFLYSIAKLAGAITELEKRCMNSLINLAPACQPCNSSRSNPVKF